MLSPVRYHPANEVGLKLEATATFPTSPDTFIMGTMDVERYTGTCLIATHARSGKFKKASPHFASSPNNATSANAAPAWMNGDLSRLGPRPLHNPGRAAVTGKRDATLGAGNGSLNGRSGNSVTDDFVMVSNRQTAPTQDARNWTGMPLVSIAATVRASKLKAAKNAAKANHKNQAETALNNPKPHGESTYWTGVQPVSSVPNSAGNHRAKDTLPKGPQHSLQGAPLIRVPRKGGNNNNTRNSVVGVVGGNPGNKRDEGNRMASTPSPLNTYITSQHVPSRQGTTIPITRQDDLIIRDSPSPGMHSSPIPAHGSTSGSDGDRSNSCSVHSDSSSILSDEGSNSGTSEISLPRIIKPRKRRKKDKRLAALTSPTSTADSEDLLRYPVSLNPPRCTYINGSNAGVVPPVHEQDQIPVSELLRLSLMDSNTCEMDALLTGHQYGSWMATPPPSPDNAFTSSSTAPHVPSPDMGLMDDGYGVPRHAGARQVGAAFGSDLWSPAVMDMHTPFAPVSSCWRLTPCFDENRNEIGAIGSTYWNSGSNPILRKPNEAAPNVWKSDKAPGRHTWEAKTGCGSLEVSSEIITSPYGHRDIEIRFFSNTRSISTEN